MTVRDFDMTNGNVEGLGYNAHEFFVRRSVNRWRTHAHSQNSVVLARNFAPCSAGHAAHGKRDCPMLFRTAQQTLKQRSGNRRFEQPNDDESDDR